MRRLGWVCVLLWALGGPAGAQLAMRAEHVAAGRAPATAPGVVIWLHGGYAEGTPPETPGFLHRFTEAGWDLYRQDRPPFRRGDPLAPAAEALAVATRDLRAAGYRQVALAGKSRGAFVILVALSHPHLADAALLLAPAAHGTRPDRRDAAMADYRAALDTMAPDALRRIALVQFAEDPYDPDPPARRDALLGAARARGIAALSVFHPETPRGHTAMREDAFDARFGACVAEFLDVTHAAPARCE